MNYATREDRISAKCNSEMVGDEFHFILTCTNPDLMDLRENSYHPITQYTRQWTNYWSCSITGVESFLNSLDMS